MFLRAVLLLYVIFFTIHSAPSDAAVNGSTTLSRSENDICFKALNNVKPGNELRAIRYPCVCLDGQCGCCSGNILHNFNINLRQRFCLNVTYDADEAAVGMKFSLNDFTFYKSSVSGRNPPPVCIPIPRFTSIRLCVRFNNVYFIDRNFHACINVESQWNKQTSFSYNFDCIRIGLDGVAVVRPEDGGGLPEPLQPNVDIIEEYDELLENQSTTTRRPTGNKKKKNKTRPATTQRPKILTTLN